MAILLDASAILAAADTADLNHAAARAWFTAAAKPAGVVSMTRTSVPGGLQDATASTSGRGSSWPEA